LRQKERLHSVASGVSGPVVSSRRIIAIADSNVLVSLKVTVVDALLVPEGTIGKSALWSSCRWIPLGRVYIEVSS
jgi:hypothetical protein